MTKRSFQITMQVPIGLRKGTLSWEEQDGILRGTLDIMRHRNPFSGTITPDARMEQAGTVRLEGSMAALVREIPYTAAGAVAAGRLSLELKEPRHVYQIEGVEIEDA